MRRSSVALAILVLAGCGDSTPRNAVDTAPGPVISDFKAPSLQGLKVQDHPKGAQVVERFEAPWTIFDACVVFTSFNGTPIRDAAHFRDLTNAAAEAAASNPSGEFSLSHEILPPHERRDCERRANQ